MPVRNTEPETPAFTDALPSLAWFILPVTTASVQALVPYPLLTPPYSDKSLFPHGFPSTAHPVLVSSGYENDIRMLDLQIPSLKQGSIYIPYTDRLKDGKTAFNYVSLHTLPLLFSLSLEAIVELHRRHGWRIQSKRHLIPTSCSTK